jgi:hypothetical protein
VYLHTRTAPLKVNVTTIQLAMPHALCKHIVHDLAQHEPNSFTKNNPGPATITRCKTGPNNMQGARKARA